MDFIRTSIEKPVTVLVGVILVTLFGIISLYRLPYQLSPSVVEPEITVETTWRGATPYEVEREIIEEQEKVLKGIPGLVEMESDSFNGRGAITLRFKLGTDLDDALLRVSNKINEVRSYPEGVDRPVISATGAATNPVIWVVMKTMEGNDRSVATYRTYFENDIRQHMERVEGVADLFIGGGTEEEMQIIVDPERLAAYSLTIGDVISVLRDANANISAGNLGVGRRDYRIRTTGEFGSPGEIARVVLRSDGQHRIFLGDVAEIRQGYEKKRASVFQNGDEGMAIGIKPEPGTNVLAMTDKMQEVVDWLNETKLHPRKIHLQWVYDQRFYIKSAIDLIKQNILIGGALAISVLLIFLRSIRSTLVVAAAIPVSIIGTFIFLAVMGRNLNVVSLAGIAFAVGMLVDNSIVVIENIDRHRLMGKPAFQASLDGAREVWGAVLASTLTTVAVFLPVVFIEEEAGQLFRDIAIAVVAAVSLSLFVSISVIPMFTNKVFGGTRVKKKGGKDILGALGGGIARAIMATVSLAVRNWFTRIVTVASLVIFSILSVYLLMPKTDYLPQGNRNLVLSILIPPAGLSVQEREGIGEKLFEMAGPHLGKDHEGFPGIENMFFVSNEGFMLIGAISTHWNRAAELIPLFERMIFSIPGMFGFTQQAGIFQTSLGKNNTISVDLSSERLDRIVAAAGAMFGKISQALPGAQIRPVPSLDLGYPEFRVRPLRDRLQANAMSARDLGVAVDVIMDGRIVGEYKEEGKKKIDLVLMASDRDISTPEDLVGAFVTTPGGRAVPVSTLAEFEDTTGMTQIRHLERNRTVSLQIAAPGDIPLQAAMETIEKDIIEGLRSEGTLDGVDIRLSGAAGKLTQTRKSLQWNFVLAAAISFLLMASLFENFFYPLIILTTVPLAGAGGFIGLKLVDTFLVSQPMDVLTMLGFVILIGVVVNNAILIVHQALNNIRHGGMAPMEAVLASTESRLRPIFMSATTSIFGMLPLILFPGAGSELYRGLGSVILGGIAVSTIFTIFIIPSILLFSLGMERKQA